MAGKRPTPSPRRQDSPIYGYDSPVVQNTYTGQDATSVADFFLPHLQAGMTFVDCGCGPGDLTLGLAEVVAPGPVVGIDLEPSMIAQAAAAATQRQVDTVHFQTANICALPFGESSFDRLFSSAVLEQLRDPETALQEMYRVVKPGGIVGIITIDWGEPLISPPDESVRQFFALFARGFRHHGGSLNRGRHLRQMMRQAGFDVMDFLARFHNIATPEALQRAIPIYVTRLENLPLFEEAIALGWVDRATLERMATSMRQWSEHPDAFLALARCQAIGRKE